MLAINFYQLVQNHWQRASPWDFAILAIAAVLSVWFFTNYRD